MKALLVIALAASVAGCVSTPNSANVYRNYQAQNEQIVRMGQVESVREVRIANPDSGTGAMAGAALGGIAAGSNIGSGSGSAAAAIVGALAGGLIGQRIEANANTRRAQEITVRLDNGELRAITQEADQMFYPGQRVRLLSSYGVTRVTP
jgi:outer membrane lipoprotein SlyB